MDLETEKIKCNGQKHSLYTEPRNYQSSRQKESLRNQVGLRLWIVDEYMNTC